MEIKQHVYPVNSEDSPQEQVQQAVRSVLLEHERVGRGLLRVQTVTRALSVPQSGVVHVQLVQPVPLVAVDLLLAQLAPLDLSLPQAPQAALRAQQGQWQEARVLQPVPHALQEHSHLNREEVYAPNVPQELFLQQMVLPHVLPVPREHSPRQVVDPVRPAVQEVMHLNPVQWHVSPLLKGA